MESIAGFAGAVRAFLAMFSDDGKTWSVTSEWCVTDLPPRLQHCQSVPFGSLPWSEARLLADQPVVFNTPDELPAEANAERRALRDIGHSALVMPLKVAAGSVSGCVGLFGGARPPWSDIDVARLRMVAESIAGVIQRKKAAEERSRLEEQLRQAQKLESMGRLAGGVAHDFNNLLTIISGYTALALIELKPDDPLQRFLTEIRQAGTRAEGLTRQLLAFSRKQVIEPKPLNLNHLISETQSMFQRIVREDIEIITDLSPELGLVMADSGQLHQVLMNLVVNARDAMPAGGRLTIETANVAVDQQLAGMYPEAQLGTYVSVTVADTGIGMDERTRLQIFEPFFTTKPEGVGTGLGLSTVYGIVRQGRGWISLETEPGHGAKFRIYLPRVEVCAYENVSPSLGVGPLRGSESILIVEDQAELRRFVAEVLKSYGYRVLEAMSGGEALLLVEALEGPLHLMLTDVVMPQMSGWDLAERLKRFRPHMQVLYMSGYISDVIAGRNVLEIGADFITKPFSPEQLAEKVRCVLRVNRARS